MGQVFIWNSTFCAYRGQHALLHIWGRNMQNHIRKTIFYKNEVYQKLKKLG